MTARRLSLLPVEDVVANLNRLLTGWAGYFRHGNSTTQLPKLDRHAAEPVGALDRDAPQGEASARLRLLASAPGAVPRSATARLNGRFVLPGTVHHGVPSIARQRTAPQIAVLLLRKVRRICSMLSRTLSALRMECDD